MMNNLLILGAGGHGRVVCETAELQNKWDKIDFLDDTFLPGNENRIIGKFDDYLQYIKLYKYAFVAIGNNFVREAWIDKLIGCGYALPAIIHPRSFVSRSAKVGDGSVLLANTVLNTGSSLASGCIVNIGVIIDHDCEIGNCAHISSGTVVRSLAKVGDLCYIGASCLINSKVVIENGATIPDGTIVLNKDGE